MDIKYVKVCFARNLAHLEYAKYFLENQEDSETSMEFRFAVAALLAMGED